MIFLDANVFLRHLTQASTPIDETRKAQARALFESLQSGDVVATTSEVVIHDVCFVLHSSKQYGFGVPMIVKVVTSLVILPGIGFPGSDREIYLRALALWSQHPKLGFADSVIAARCERSGHELATFDRHFADLPFLQVWRPEGTATNQT